MNFILILTEENFDDLFAHLRDISVDRSIHDYSSISNPIYKTYQTSAARKNTVRILASREKW